MSTTHAFRVGSGLAGLLAASITLTGCMGSPTYGTSKTAAEQLVDDLGDAINIGGKKETQTVKYNPRPGLVVPASANSRTLAQPQQTLASRENNPQWVESPEETRQRLREEADANKDNPHYQSPLLVGKGTNQQMTESQKWEAFREAKKDATTVDISRRRYLTDPPGQYSQASSAEALEDTGEPELKKEKRRQKEAAMKSSNSSWWKPFQ